MRYKKVDNLFSGSSRYNQENKEELKVASKYDHEFKVQAVKWTKKIDGYKATKELGIPKGTIHTWLKAIRVGKLNIGDGSHTTASAMSLTEEITLLSKRIKEQDKRDPSSERGKRNSGGSQRFFRRQPSKINKSQKMTFITPKIDDVRIKGKTALYCRMLDIS